MTWRTVFGGVGSYIDVVVRRTAKKKWKYQGQSV